MDRNTQARWGQIGGLTAHSRHGSEQMLGGARRGFQLRFERQVDPEGTLPDEERARRADRARRAHMLTLAAKSAAARRAKRNPAPSDVRAGFLHEEVTPDDHPSAA